MIKGDWYKITEEDGTVTTGEFSGIAGTTGGLSFILANKLFFYDELVGIEKIGYNAAKKVVSTSKIGVPHG